MSKAEERSKEIIQAALDYANNLDDIKPTDEFSRNLCIALGQAFMKGAEWADSHQAEKDLGLTIEDIEKIHTFLYAVKNSKQGVFTFTRLSDEKYQEVLKRFNGQRNDTTSK